MNINKVWLNHCDWLIKNDFIATSTNYLNPFILDCSLLCVNEQSEYRYPCLISLRGCKYRYPCLISLRGCKYRYPCLISLRGCKYRYPRLISLHGCGRAKHLHGARRPALPCETRAHCSGNSSGPVLVDSMDLKRVGARPTPERGPRWGPWRGP